MRASDAHADRLDRISRSRSYGSTGVIPQGFIPRQDTGVFFGNVVAPEGTTFSRSRKAHGSRCVTVIQKNPYVESVLATAGQGTGGVVGDNIGRIIVRIEADGGTRHQRRSGHSGAAALVYRRRTGRYESS